MTMKTLLSIDVGLHGLGCGHYTGETLDAGWYTPRPGTSGRDPEGWRRVALALEGLALQPDLVVIETMKIYDQRHWKGDPDDILQLQGVVGCLSMLYRGARIRGYLPQVWKGQVPAPVLAARVEQYLGARGWSDRLVLPARSEGRDRSGDVLHGVGVGLHHLGLMHGGKTVKRG